MSVNSIQYILEINGFVGLKERTNKTLDDQANIAAIAQEFFKAKTTSEIKIATKHLAEIFSKSERRFPSLLEIASKVITQTHQPYKTIMRYKIKNDKGMTPLHYAAQEGILNDIQLIIDHDPSLLRAQDHQGKTPLHLAVIHNHLNVVKAFISHDSSLLRTKDNYGKTPFYMAMYEGHPEIILAIIKHSNETENPSLLIEKDLNDVAPLSLLAKTSNLKIEPFQIPPIHVAIIEGYFDLIKAIIALEPSLLKVKDRNGETPLHYAARYGHLSIVTAIVDHNPSLLNETNNTNMKPRDIAEKMKHHDLIQVIDAKRNNPYKKLKFWKKNRD